MKRDPISTKLALAVLVIAITTSVVACGDDDSNGASGGDATAKTSGAGGVDESEEVKIAYLTAVANNYYQPVYEGIEKVAKEHNASVKLFDAGFDATKQFNQMQDAIASGQFDAMIVSAVDGATMLPAVKQAQDADIPVVADSVALGPDYKTPDPQVPGVVGSVLNPAILDGEVGLEATVDACVGLDPCNLVYILGTKSYGFDVARLKYFKDQLESHPNIKLVAEVEGQFLADPALKAMQDVLQAHPDVDVVNSSGDQMIVGAEKAIKAAGKKVGGKDGIKLIGTGASKDAAKGIEDGRWFASTVFLPTSSGETSGKMAIDAARGVLPEDPGVFTGDLSPVGPVVTAANAAKFTPQW